MVKTKKTRKIKKRFLWIALILAAGIGIFIFVNKTRGGGPAEQLFTVQESMYRNVIEIAGNIQAARQQIIQAPGEGILESIHVAEGDHVHEGQLLFQLDDYQERYNLANHEFLMSQERINGASARLALMEEQRQVLIRNIQDRRVEALFDGVIGQSVLIEGNYAKPQDTLGYLIDRSYLKATVEVVEADASRLKTGQRVSLHFPAYPDVEVEGYVVSYPAVARISTRGVVVLDAQIRVDQFPEEILPGYSFTGEIIAGPDEMVVTVEASAIAYENGNAYVDRVIETADRTSDSTAETTGPVETERVWVTVEPYGRQLVRIRSGLAAGDRVKLQANADSGIVTYGDSQMVISL